MLLGDEEIKKCIADGSIVISPFNPKFLGTNSYDVTIGNWYYKPITDPEVYDINNRYDIYSEKSTREYWGEPQRAHKEILLYPNLMYLCHTQEIIGGRRDITTMLKCRSSVGRSGISICRDAGMGDIGYQAIWTLEVINHSNEIIPLPVGSRVAQMLFFRVENARTGYNGNYGQGDWSPEDLLPKLWKDKEFGKP